MQIYVHIPFCKSKCRYCDFNSYPNCNDTTILRYLNGLKQEISLAGRVYGNAKIDTVYIGGGTPSILREEWIISICDALKNSFDLSQVKEWTIECNPESITDSKLKAYKKCGINRLSIGVQSLSDDNLRAVGRVHDSKCALEKLRLAREYFSNVSCDLIVGLPYDNANLIANEIKTLAPLVEHISMYELILEEGTPLFEQVKSGNISLLSDDEVQDIFDIAIQTAKEQGLMRYEVSNFARENKHSLHNYGYWIREEYLGFGAGAHSLIKHIENDQKYEVRYSNFKDLSTYLTAVENAKGYDDINRDEHEILSEKDIKNEQIMLGLRTLKGVESSLLNLPQNLKSFFEEESGYTHLTQEGIAVMNSILTELLDL